MKKVIILFIQLNLTIGLFGQPIADMTKLDDFIEMVMEDWGVPGIAITIVKEDSVLYQKAYGVENMESKKAVTTNTLFSIASSTKSFTATTSAVLSESGDLNYDTPLIDYFPDFRLYDDLATKKVTIVDLLTHRTGVPRQKFFSLNTPETRFGVREAFRFFEPSADFRTEFQYCNESYTVAGDMIAELAHTTWEELVKKSILEPLEMENTIFSIHSLDESMSFATPYIDWEGFPEEMDFHDADILGPAGCMISNVKDLSNWLIFNINGGKYKENQVIDEKFLSQLYIPRIVANPVQSSQEISYQCYGIGWFIDYYKGYKRIHHGGVLYGFSSQVSFLPKEKIGVAVLANLNGTIATGIIERYVYDMLLDLEKTDWNKRYLDQKNAYLEYIKSKKEKEVPDEPEKIVPEVELNDIVGKYYSNGYGSFEVYLKQDTLRAKLLDYECSFIPISKKTFSLYHPVERHGWPVSLIQNEKGDVESLVLGVNPGLKGIEFKRSH